MSVKGKDTIQVKKVLLIGRSLAITLPKEARKYLKPRENVLINFKVDKGRLILEIIKPELVQEFLQSLKPSS